MRDQAYQRPIRRTAQARAAVARRANSENHGTMVSGVGLFVLAAAVLLLLSGCQTAGGFGYTNDEVKQASLKASDFNRNLYEDYLELSTAEHAEYDWRDARYFAAKALSAAKDEQVGPENIHERDLPAERVEELSDARGQLTAALERGAAVKAPADAARAQASFDCWLQEQEENFQLDDIAACRDAFAQAMDRVEGALGEQYTIYFEFDSAKLTEDAKTVLTKVIESAGGKAGATVLIDGHADSPGTDDYNMALSEARVEAIKSLLLSAGVKSGQIGTAGYGETRPAVHAPEGVPEPRNRRVEINVTR